MKEICSPLEVDQYNYEVKQLRQCLGGDNSYLIFKLHVFQNNNVVSYLPLCIMVMYFHMFGATMKFWSLCYMIDDTFNYLLSYIVILCFKCLVQA